MNSYRGEWAISGGNTTKIPLEVVSVFQWNSYKRCLSFMLEQLIISAGSSSKMLLSVANSSQKQPI